MKLKKNRIFSPISWKIIALIAACLLFFILLFATSALAQEINNDAGFDYLDTSGLTNNTSANPDENLNNNADETQSESRSIFDVIFNKAKNSLSSTENTQDVSEILSYESKKNLENKEFAKIRVIDKNLGKHYDFTVKVGTKKILNELYIKTYSCLIPNTKTIIPESRALIEVQEYKNKVANPIFKGWIISDASSISKPSHPKYTIFIMGCTNQE